MSHYKEGCDMLRNACHKRKQALTMSKCIYIYRPLLADCYVKVSMSGQLCPIDLRSCLPTLRSHIHSHNRSHIHSRNHSHNRNHNYSGGG